MRKIFYSNQEDKAASIEKDQSFNFKSDARFLDLMHKTNFINKTIYSSEEASKLHENSINGLNMTKEEKFTFKQKFILNNSNSLMVGFNNLTSFDFERQN